MTMPYQSTFMLISGRSGIFLASFPKDRDVNSAGKGKGRLVAPLRRICFNLYKKKKVNLAWKSQISLSISNPIDVTWYPRVLFNNSGQTYIKIVPQKMFELIFFVFWKVKPLWIFWWWMDVFRCLWRIFISKQFIGLLSFTMIWITMLGKCFFFCLFYF